MNRKANTVDRNQDERFVGFFNDVDECMLFIILLLPNNNINYCDDDDNNIIIKQNRRKCYWNNIIHRQK
jgi:hypothetical protein